MRRALLGCSLLAVDCAPTSSADLALAETHFDRESAPLFRSASNSGERRRTAPDQALPLHEALLHLGAGLSTDGEGLEHYHAPTRTRRPAVATRIPQTIYRTFETDLLTRRFIERLNATAVANPSWSHVFFTRRQREAFVARACSARVNEAYRRVAPASGKADVFRLCLLHAKGGLYLDAGVELGVDFSSALMPAAANASFISARDAGSDGLLNGIMAATPRLPVLAEALDRVASNAETCYYGENAIQPTGPELLGGAYNAVYGGGRPGFDRLSVPGQTIILPSAQSCECRNKIFTLSTPRALGNATLGTTKFAGQADDFAQMGYDLGTKDYSVMWASNEFWGPPCSVGGPPRNKR